MEEETQVNQKRMTLLPPSWKQQPVFLPDTNFIQHNENFVPENEFRLEIRSVTKCLFLGSMRLKPVPLKSPEMLLELGKLMESPVNAKVMPLDLSLDHKTSRFQQAESERSESPEMDYAMFENPPDIECEQNMEILGHETVELPDQEEPHFGEGSSVLEFCGVNQDSDSDRSDPEDETDGMFTGVDVEMKNGVLKQSLDFTTTAETLEQYTQAMAYIQMMSTIQMSMQAKVDESGRPADNQNMKKYLKRTPKCKICSKIFTSYVKLRKHRLEHDGDKPYICKDCGKSHATLDQLIVHMRTHEGKRPYICKKCTKTFKTANALEEHKAVHVLRKEVVVPKKIFQCEICNKEFRKLCDLERHTRVHTGEKPSVCNICNRRFQQAHNLNKHLLIHTQEKPFQCDICKKKFGRNDVLNRHLLTHSVKKPNDCSFCGKTFIRSTQLAAHIEKYHGSS